jgi:hypothetical protein
VSRHGEAAANTGADIKIGLPYESPGLLLFQPAGEREASDISFAFSLWHASLRNLDSAQNPWSPKSRRSWLCRPTQHP